MSKNTYIIYLLILAFLVLNCTGCIDDRKGITKCKISVDKKRVTPNGTIKFDLSSDPEIPSSSLKFYFDDIELFSNTYQLENASLGKHRLLSELVLIDSVICDAYKTIEVYSDIEPKTISFSVVAQYPHEIESYTQGLTWYDGSLYEGTGQYGDSFLAEVDHKTGKAKRKKELTMDYFGEGIAILKDKVYQLTYISQKCFVYDLNTFEKIDEFEYNSQEGWGLTTDGTSLILSDGSHRLTFIDPESFEIQKVLDVYDQKQRVAALNELEYANGLIYSNIYHSDKIAVIEATTGKIISYLDCSGLLDKSSVNTQIDVLNGIAFEPNSGHLFVTGKWWPTMFELELD